MKINVTIQGAIDVPDEWEDPENGTTAVDVADYRYNEQLTENEAIDELAQKLKAHPDELEVIL